ncbi:intermembrane lipid transfer protein VPS13A-like [Bolinopsis microptera]|uniref:intermembrane lipid transfer protein VPS13A-like n=1 Tax=Bolinopsis microptera TaxID=2820187 RepID=UPI003079016D
MFERVLETVLEKVLGEFVQDINSKDLKLAVWSGNVVLKNLRLKAEALAKFDLPVFVYAGLIGSLELQVPWKALWTAPTKVVVEDLVLLVVPKEAAPYNEEKAKKEERARKKAMLQAVEEAQTRMSETQGKGQKQTWAESLITAIIKNLELNIKNIHIRYEDPDSGYAAGVTLDHLYATTTDEMWSPAVISNQTIQRIFKLAKIENFCVYWNNPSLELFNLPQHKIEAELLKLIVTKATPNSQHNFVIHPMGCEVKMVIDPSNKVVMDVPKATASVHFSSLTTEVRKTQYLDTMSLLDSMERGKKKQPFAKWHPGTPIKGNARKWWQYLHRYCVETRVKRRIIAWRWSSIRRHREMCREYTNLRVKEMVGKPTLNELARITEIFDTLDIVNITICEQSAKLEADKVQASTSWFGGWWGGGTSRSTTSVVDKFGMSTEEKDTLYSAIEQSEAAASSQIYPEKYVKFRLKLDVDKVSFKLNDDIRVITEAAVKGITSEVGIIPNNNGIVLSYQIHTVYVLSDKVDILIPSDSHAIVILVC